MSQNNVFNSGEFQYTPNRNLTTLQNVYVPHTDSLQNLVLQLLAEVKSLKSDISDIKKDINELKDGNKRSLTKLTEEVIAVKLENRKHHDDNVLFNEQSDLRKFLMVAMTDIEKFDYEVQKDEDKLGQFKQFIAKTGGEGPAQFIRAAVRKVFSDELACLYSRKGTSTKPSAQKIYLITIIKAISHHKFKCTDKDMDAVLQKHFVHAKDRVAKRKHQN